MPTVSVLIPSYNYATYLPDCLKSVIEQSFQDIEILVIDDGSADDSVQIAQAVASKDSRIRVLQHPDGGNHGLAASLQLGLTQAQGRWIAILESDDFWEKDCLACRISATTTYDSVGVVLNNIALLTMPGSNPLWYEQSVPQTMRWHSKKKIYRPNSAFVLRNRIPTFSCAMIRTDFFRTLSFDSPIDRWLDWWIWTQLAFQTDFYFVPQQLTHWRIHATSWHHKISFWSYLHDYRQMTIGLRQRLSPHLKTMHNWSALVLLWMPIPLRLALRFSCSRPSSLLSRFKK